MLRLLADENFSGDIVRGLFLQLRAFRTQGLLDAHAADDMLCWQASGGFSVDQGSPRYVRCVG